MKNVGDLLREKGNDIYATSPDATVYEALKQMAEKNVGALLVFEENRLAGLISERDYARKIILKHKTSKETAVSEIMTGEVITISPDMDLEHCMEIISEKHLHHLPVVEDEKVLGIISIGDIVRGIIEHKEYMIDQLEKYIKGHHR